MASKYLQQFPVPHGFQEVLADLTREILREQPNNIIEFAALYFEGLEKGEKGAARKGEGVSARYFCGKAGTRRR